MNYTISAFLASSHTQALVAIITKEWEASGKTTFAQYRTFFNRKLCNLYNDGDCGNQVNSALEASVCDIQEENQEMCEQMANMANSQDNLHDKPA